MYKYTADSDFILYSMNVSCLQQQHRYVFLCLEANPPPTSPTTTTTTTHAYPQ